MFVYHLNMEVKFLLLLVILDTVTVNMDILFVTLELN